MPIYAYRCGACGHSKDVLQRMSDPVLSTCPVCGAEAFSKQVTAAGFQLKGSGWYVTDFKGGNAAPAAKVAEGADTKPAADAAGAAKLAAGAVESTTASAAPAAPAPAAPAASPPPTASGS